MKPSEFLVKNFTHSDIVKMAKEIKNWNKTGVVPEEAILRKFAKGLESNGLSEEHAALLNAERLVANYAIEQLVKNSRYRAKENR
jgi:hypothetical protein